MRFFVTGGAGFLGYHLVDKLASSGHKVVLLDIAPFNKEEYPSGVEFLNGDVRDASFLEKAMHGIDVVIHAAAALPLWKSKDIFEINVNGTENVLLSAVKNKIARVIFISSTAVYGVPKKHPLYEDDMVVGVGPYGKSKIQAEALLRSFREKGICASIIRPKTFIGTGRLGVFQILYDWVESGKKIPIIGNGKNRYQLLEVSDLVEAIYLASTVKPDCANHTFNIGAEKFGTVLEDVGSLCDFAKTGSAVLKTPAWLVKPLLMLLEACKLSPLYKWVYGTADTDSFVSIDKTKELLKWAPKYSNSDALIRSYKWYLEHKGEIVAGTGITHRIAWNQGILRFFKKFL